MKLRRILAMVRAPLWWTPKVLPVVAAAALGALTADVSGRRGVVAVVAMLISATGVAAFAHLVNDLADRDADRRAGKRNVVADSPGRGPLLLLAACAVPSVVPWLLVPIGWPAALTLVALVVVSVAYSAPPIRLKQRGFAGVLADALVAHVLPTLFAFMLMGSTGTRTTSWWVATSAATIWSLGFGIRSIVVHQIVDEEGDRRAGVATFVVRRGRHRAARAGRDAFALELAGLAALAVVSVWVAWGAAAFFVVHFALWLNHRRWERPDIDTVPTRVGQWLPLAEFYEVWPAVTFCAVLTVRDLTWGWLLVAILVVFGSAVQKQALDQLAMFAEVLTVLHRLYPPVRLAMRETWFAAVRSWWAVYRFHWRVRHWFGPLVLFVRRQRRRARRLLRGDAAVPPHH